MNRQWLRFGVIRNVCGLSAPGFFDTVEYSKLDIEGVVTPYAEQVGDLDWALMLHDAAPTHNNAQWRKAAQGQTRGAGPSPDHCHVDAGGQPQNVKDWSEDRSIVEGKIPRGMTSFRPNDKIMYD